MSHRSLALALAVLMMAPCGQAEEPAWPSSRLKQRAGERGPIRTQIEAALAAPAGVVTAQAVEAARREARKTGPGSSGSSIPGWVWALIVVGGILALLHEYGKAWSKI